uniref:Lamin n=1 Tax=Ditylenchus dipsaci TaxID=166011 RepID=A0A915D0L8_9BILA
MSSKSKKTKTVRESLVVETRGETSSTHDEGNETANISPNNSTTGGSRWSRQQEKVQLSHLNDRLATYIEKVRNLETENARLHVQIRDVEQLDFITREKAKLEIERAKAVDGYDELKARNAKVEKELKQAEAHIKDAYNDVQDLTARYNNANNARNIAERRMMHSKKNWMIVLRTELENKLATYKEDLDFARRSHTNQMEEFRRKRQVEMTSFSTEVENRYQVKLQEQLHNMRADFDARIAQSRAEVDELYKNKLAEANEAAARNRATAADAREEATALNRRINELEKDLRRLHEETDIRIQQKDERINLLENEAAAMMNEYQDLMDLKVQLDTELQAYQKLLEGEETRLHITPVASPNVSQQTHHVSFTDSPGSIIHSSLRRGTKRRRLDQEDFVDFDQSSKTYKSNSHSDVDIVIDELDTEGGFIRLSNKGEDDMSIGGWFVKSTAGEKEVMFKFHTRQILKSGKSITLWSNNSGQEHSPPQNIVMKNQSWPTSDAIRVELLNDDKEVLAWRECILEHGFYRTENGADPDQRCAIIASVTCSVSIALAYGEYPGKGAPQWEDHSNANFASSNYLQQQNQLIAASNNLFHQNPHSTGSNQDFYSHHEDRDYLHPSIYRLLQHQALLKGQNSQAADSAFGSSSLSFNAIVPAPNDKSQLVSSFTAAQTPFAAFGNGRSMPRRNDQELPVEWPSQIQPKVFAAPPAYLENGMNADFNMDPLTAMPTQRFPINNMAAAQPNSMIGYDGVGGGGDVNVEPGSPFEPAGDYAINPRDTGGGDANSELFDNQNQQMMPQSINGDNNDNNCYPGMDCFTGGMENGGFVNQQAFGSNYGSPSPAGFNSFNSYGGSPNQGNFPQGYEGGGMFGQNGGEEGMQGSYGGGGYGMMGMGNFNGQQPQGGQEEENDQFEYGGFNQGQPQQQGPLQALGFNGAGIGNLPVNGYPNMGNGMSMGGDYNGMGMGQSSMMGAGMGQAWDMAWAKAWAIKESVQAC